MARIGKWEMSENDRVLDSLLDGGDRAIEWVKAEFEGAPLHVVDTALVRALATAVPAAKFTAGDIRSRASAFQCRKNRGL